MSPASMRICAVGSKGTSLYFVSSNVTVFIHYDLKII